MKNVSTINLLLFIILCLIAFEAYATPKTWLGTTNIWSNPYNWTPTGEPGASDNVFIPPGTSFEPTIDNSTLGNCRDLTIESGATLTQTGGSLTVAGNLKIEPGANFIQTDGVLGVDRDWGNSGTFYSSGGTVVFTGTAGGQSDFSSGSNQFFNLTINSGVDPEFENKSVGNIYVAGDFTNYNSTLNVTSAHFTFNGSGDQTINSASFPADVNSTFGTLTVNKTGGTLYLDNDLGVVNFTDPPIGTLEPNGFNFYVGGNGTPFPVELVSFNAKISDGKVILNWNTSTEVNNYGFEVQRSVKANNWEVLGFVEGYGNSNSPKTYNFTDNKLNVAGTYSYRLKQIDNDGDYEFSKTIGINISSPITVELKQNFPNPFNPSTTISFTLPESGNVSLEIYSPTGEEVATLVNGYMEAGIYQFNFNAKDYPSGIYVYRLNTNKNALTKKMLLLK